MTSLETRKTRLVFRTMGLVREKGRTRPIILEARRFCALVRLQGLRVAYPISWEAIYHAAAKIAAEQARAAIRTERWQKEKEPW